ncbi:hypothetical protein Tco_1176057 [Tanacetum coccineum]
MQCTTYPNHSSFLLNRTGLICPQDTHRLSIDNSLREFILHRLQSAPASENIRVILLVFTMKMEILLESTSNKLSVDFQDGIEVDKAKVNVIAKLPHPTTVKEIRSFLGHAGFYRRFIQDFSKIAWPMTRLLEKDTSFFFSKECIEAFQTLKKKLTEAPILVALD